MWPAEAHKIEHLNDGKYGNNFSWLSLSDSSFAGISLGAEPVQISSLAFGRDNTGQFKDRAEGLYTLQYTTMENPDASTANSLWKTFATVKIDSDQYSAPHLRHRFDFAPISATGVRIITTKAEGGENIAIDEIELFSNRFRAPGLPPLEVSDAGVWIGQAMPSLNGQIDLAQSFVGTLDDLVVWGRVLSQSEIAAARAGTVATSDASLVGYWPFNDVGGRFATDRSSLKNDAVLVTSVGETALKLPEWASPQFRTFTPAQPGRHFVSVAAYDGDGGSDSTQTSFNVTTSGPTLRQWGAETTLTASLDFPLQFDGENIVEAGLGRTLDFFWEVISNNGQTVASSTNHNFAFTPMFSGRYTVTLTATDDLGQSVKSATQNFDVQPVAVINSAADAWLEFAGTGGAEDVLLLPSSTIDGSESLTLQLRFSTEHTSAQRILHSSDGANGSYQIELTADGLQIAVRSSFEGATSTEYLFDLPTKVNDGSWHELVLVRDANTNQSILFIDGQLAGKRFGADYSAIAAIDNVEIGRGPTGTGKAFIGAIDDLLIWNTARTEVQIRSQVPTAGDSNLLAWLNFNELPQELVVFDQSGQANYGLLGTGESRPSRVRLDGPITVGELIHLDSAFTSTLAPQGAVRGDQPIPRQFIWTVDGNAEVNGGFNDSTFSFRPNTSGEFTVTLAVTDTFGAQSISSEIISQIISVKAPQIVISQVNGPTLTSGGEPIDFAFVKIGNSKQREIKIDNTGTADLIISGIIGGTTNGFAVDTNGLTFPHAITPGSSRSFFVSYTPTTLNPQASTLRILSSDRNASTFELALTAKSTSASPFSPGTALRFDNPQAVVETNASLSAASGTWEAWIQKDDWAENAIRTMLDNGVAFETPDHFSIALRSEGLTVLYGHSADPIFVLASSGVTRDFEPGTWHHLAASWDFDSATRRVTIKLFVDGEEVASRTSFNDGSPIEASPKSFYGGFDPVFRFRNGLMDEVRIWSEARTELEIKSTMNVSLIAGQPGLSAYYRFDEGSGNQILDATSTAQKGVNLGASYVLSDAPLTARGVSFVGTEGDDVISVGWYIDEENADQAACAFDNPPCDHVDFLAVTINDVIYNMVYTPVTNSETVFVFGGGGNDRIEMDPESAQHWNAAFFGEEGDDILVGASHRFGSDRGGKDLLDGGPGNDILIGGSGNDELLGGPGNDELQGGAGDDLLNGGDDDDLINGGEQPGDIVIASAGVDTLTRVKGVRFEGTDGDDVILIDWYIDENHADDEECAFDIDFCAHNDFLLVTINDQVYHMEYTPQDNAETIFVFAGAGDDRIEMTAKAAQHWNAEFHGEEGDDILIGAANRYGIDRGGKDRLFGGPGNDFLDGGEGQDLLDGGAGVNDIVKASTGGDTLRDIARVNFTGTQFDDTIDVDWHPSDGRDVLDVTINGQLYTMEIDSVTGTETVYVATGTGNDATSVSEEANARWNVRFEMAGDDFGAPTIISATDFSLPEHQRLVVDMEVLDPNGLVEGDGLTYRLAGGVDEHLFELDANTGVLSFKVAPTFDAPSDHDGDSTYEVLVTAGNVHSLSDTREVRVRVVEDIQGSDDFGNAEESLGYPTSLSRNGARHAVGALFLGTSTDREPNSQVTDDGDERGGAQGVAWLTSLVSAAQPTTASILVQSSQIGKLDAWIDFNQDGDWEDPFEQIFASEDISAGGNLLTFQIPVGASAGVTYSRVRLSSVGGLSFSGPAADGEVEDYLVEIVEAGNVEANVYLTTANSIVTTQQGQVAVATAGTTIYSSPISGLNRLRIFGNDNSNTLKIADLDGLGSVQVEFDGQTGSDMFAITGTEQRLDLAQSQAAFRNLQTIDLTTGRNNLLVISPSSLSAITDESSVLVVRQSADNQVLLTPGWDIGRPELVDGKFQHILRQGNGELRLENDHPWTNPLELLDINGDSFVSPIDALLGINRLNLSGSLALGLPAESDLERHRYWDVNRDNFLSPIDVLLIINYLNQQGVAGEGEAQVTNSNALAPFENDNALASPCASNQPTETMKMEIDAFFYELEELYEMREHQADTPSNFNQRARNSASQEYVGRTRGSDALDEETLEFDLEGLAREFIERDSVGLSPR